jgi:glycerophosphoryl diester phosphodiesterase
MHSCFAVFSRALLAAFVFAFHYARAEPALERLKYNNPGLVVDLGVGLWAFPLPLDFNGDGNLDLAVSCPDKPFNGTYFFEAPSGPAASGALPIFKAGRRVSRGLQFAGVSFIHARPRVLAAGKEFPDFLSTGLERETKLPLPANVHPKSVRGNFWRYVDYDGDGRTDVVVGADDWSDYGWDNAYDGTGRWTNGPLRGFVYWARNTGSEDVPVYAKPERIEVDGKPLETFGWPSPCFADFKGTGRLDLICGEFLDGFTYFQNVGTRTDPKYQSGVRLKLANGEPLRMDLQMITPTVIDWNGDGRPDLIVGDEDGRVAFVENSGTVDSDGTPGFKTPRYFQQEADDLKCGALATPVGVDWDGDGAMDILSGNTAGYIQFFKNLSPPGVEKPKWAAPRFLEADGKVIRFMAGPNGSIQGPAEAKWGYTTLSVADWDGDGLPDLVVNSILGKVVWFRNIGSRTVPLLAAAAPVEVEWEGAQPVLDYGWMRPEGKALLTQWRTTPCAVDWNRDGLVDLVMLDQQGYLAFFERAVQSGRRVLLAPRRVFCNEAGEPLLLSKGRAGKSGRRKLCIVDWDGDGKLDILLNSSNANLLRQVGTRDGRWLFQNMGPISDRNIEGHDVSPAVVDFDADGVPDFLGGAEDGRFYYLRNPRSQGRADAGHLPMIFAHRGASGERPEHTLGAYRLALEQGADYVEPDLRLTSDGVFIALHDESLNRTTDIAEHPEFEVRARLDKRGRKVWLPGDFTLAELRTLRCVQGTAGRPKEFDRLEPIPTLEEVVGLVRAWNNEKGGRAGIVPELRGAPELFVEFVRSHRLEEAGAPPVYLQSFEASTLRKVRLELKFPAAFLSSKRPDSKVLAEVSDFCTAVAVGKAACLSEDAAGWIQEAGSFGLSVVAWTFEDGRFDRSRFTSPREEIECAFRNGVSAVFTDFPATGVNARSIVFGR